MAGTHLGVVKTSASPAWVDHTSDRLIKGSGRSCSPMSRERDRVLFAAREPDGATCVGSLGVADVSGVNIVKC